MDAAPAEPSVVRLGESFALPRQAIPTKKG
jgi:hypothetical protein